MSDFRLYLLCRRFEALVASQLGPEEFGSYMSVGTLRQSAGEVLFIEVSPDGLPDYFDIERARRECVTHSDGTPHHSKYVRTYRALEHIPVENLGALHMATRDGRVMGVEPREYSPESEQDELNMYCELCPASPLVVSSLGPRQFLRHLTDPAEPVCYPRVFMADMLIDREEGGDLASYLPYPHPAHIHECLRQVTGDKASKVVDRSPHLTAFFRTIRRGFFLGDQERMIHYPFPSREELDEKHHLWWRSASMG